MHAYPYGEEALRLQAAQLFDAQEELVGFEETPPRVGGSSVFAHMFTIMRSVVECSGAGGFCHCRADRLTMRELDKQRGSIIGIGQVELEHDHIGTLTLEIWRLRVFASCIVGARWRQAQSVARVNVPAWSSWRST